MTFLGLIKYLTDLRTFFVTLVFLKYFCLPIGFHKKEKVEKHCKFYLHIYLKLRVKFYHIDLGTSLLKLLISFKSFQSFQDKKC
jgi:hypothetical protein